ncbi:MAG: hypothetical protein AAGG01_15035 [Planctomycetota bacterium]
MNLSACITCAVAGIALLTPETSALQRRVIFEAVVTSVGSEQPGPFTLRPLGVGDTFQVEVGLPTSGIVSGEFTFYPVEPYVGGLRGELPGIPISVVADPGLLATSNNDSSGLDRVVYQQFLSTGDNAQISINDPTQTLFASSDPFSQVGTYSVPAGAIAQVAVETSIGTPMITGTITAVTVLEDSSIGISFCEGWVNSTGVGGALQAFGSARISLDSFYLEASQLPPGASAFTIASMTPSFILPPGGAYFRLCLNGSIGRHLGTLGMADAGGRLTMPIGLVDFPMGPQSSGPVLSGQTWHFQTWYRDVPLSNMTAGVSVTFE